MSTIGIDPGLSGAIAHYDFASNALEVFDMPTHQIGTKRLVDHYAAARIIDDLVGRGAREVWLEQVGTRPGEGAVGAFSFGQSFGILKGICAAHFLPIFLTTPATWKGAMKVKGDKDESRAAASTLFPRLSAQFARKKDDGRAEAALIAVYGARTSAKDAA